MGIPTALLVLQAVEIRFDGFLLCLQRSCTFIIVLLYFFALILKLFRQLLHFFLFGLTLTLLTFAASCSCLLVVVALLGVNISSNAFLLDFLLVPGASLYFSFAVTACQVTALAIFILGD